MPGTYTAPTVQVLDGSRHAQSLPALQFLGDSVSSTGVLTSVTAGAFITQVIPAAGKYSVQLTWGMGTAGTARNNVLLRVGTTAFTSLVMVPAANTLQNAILILSVDGSTSIRLESGAADTGVYVGQIIYTPIT
jgi:hypothetical protein